jgi:biotin synthase
MQAARWLITHGRARSVEMAFGPDGKLLQLGADLPTDGTPFQTSGCPDCNRPFYNERPGGTMYNYPRALTDSEADRALREMEIGS